MNEHAKHGGVVVPMVTPVAPSGGLDEPAVDRLIDFLLAARVNGIFVLGTTGEAPSIPRSWRRGLVERTVRRARGRALVYAGIGDTCLADAVEAGNHYLELGVDALVAMPPVYYPVQPVDLLAWFQALLAQVRGPVILYNIPATTRVSIPLDVIARLQGHARLIGLKDSENDPKRMEEALAQFGGRPDFSIFIGVGALMAQGLKLGAEGIVPSVGNLLPTACVQLCAAATQGDWAEAERQEQLMASAAALYQKGRTLGQSLAALKAALQCRGLCGSAVLPPLVELSPADQEIIRARAHELHLLD
jgi:2-dehydro-3-deoxy-D-pentonate aldolase